MVEVFAFQCFPKDRPEWARTINAPTASKARYEYWRDVSEPWPDVKLLDIRSRKIGGPQSDDMFMHVAELRGLPSVRCGDRVTLGESGGVIVGAGGGANFEVLFDSGPYAGAKYVCHPSTLQFRRD